MMGIFKNKIFLASLILIGVLVVPIFCFAAVDPSYGLNTTAEGAYGGKPTEIKPVDLIGILVGVVLSVLGVIFLIQIIVAGIGWMTASGNEEKVTKAKGSILQATIGLVIVVSAYVVVNFVLTILLQQVIKNGG